MNTCKPTSVQIFRWTIAIIVLFTLLGRATTTQAATITVTTVADELNSDGDCSLREAIRAANQDASFDACPAGNGADQIVLPAGTYTLSVAGTGEDAAVTGDLDILQDVTIQGAGNTSTIIDGNGYNDRVFDIFSPAHVTLTRMTIQGGSDSGFCGGGIRNQGTLTLRNALVIANYSSACGGGLYNAMGATATLETVAFGNNGAPFGAAISNSGALTLTQVSLTFDTALHEAGGLENGGSATLTDVTIAFETAGERGGGIYNSGGLTVTNTTLSHNQATSGNGGGIFNQYIMSLTNVTLSANTATSGYGGGICSWSYYDSSLLNVTLNQNSARSGGGLYRDTTSGRNGAVNLKNTIVANSPVGDNCAGGITNNGDNLQYPGTSCGAGIATADPLLRPLTNNGGPTETHALRAGSPAIDAGANIGCPATDQRGVTRPQGGGCDIGAFEALFVYLPLVFRRS